MSTKLLFILNFLLFLSKASILHLKGGDIDTSNTPTLSKFGRGNMPEEKTILIIAFNTAHREVAKLSVTQLVGHSLDEYIPNNSFLVWASYDQGLAIEQIPGVEWVGKLRPKDKLPKNIIEKYKLSVTVFQHVDEAYLARMSGALIVAEAEKLGITVHVQVQSDHLMMVSCMEDSASGDTRQIARMLAGMEGVVWVETKIPAQLMPEHGHGGRHRMGGRPRRVGDL
jgi:hypothetical protein